MYVTHECICMSHMSAYVCHTRVHMYVTHDLNSCVTHEYTCMSHIAHELVSIYGMMHTVYVRWYTIST